jgi:iron complex transport system substrate-binding protein
MKRKTLHPTPFLTILMLVAALLIACNPNAANLPANPNSTSTVAPAKVVRRVVALSSLSADIIAKLDVSKLVGIPGNRLLRQNPLFANLPTVSEGQTPPNLEQILTLKPDLVIGAAGFHDQVLTRLQATGIRTLSTRVNTWLELENLTRTLATHLQANPQPLLQSYRKMLATKPTNPGSVLVLVSNQPILAPNKTSWAGDTLARLGIKNLAADLQGQSPQRGYITLAPEKILTANPDTLILIDVRDGAVAVARLVRDERRE